MPPKRKRTEDAADSGAAATTRSTRSSTRQSTGSNKDDTSSTTKPAAATKTATKASKPASATKSSEAPAAKKAKTTATTKSATAKKATPKKSKKAVEISSDEGESSFADEPPEQSKRTSQPRVSSSTTPPIAQMKSHAPSPTKSQSAAGKAEAYSADRATALFKSYADDDDPNTIGPEGFERLCTEAQVSLEGPEPLILAWQLNAKEMAKFTKEEWSKGTEAMKISSLPQLSMFLTDLENLLIHGKPAARETGKKDSYDKSMYGKYAADPDAAFKTLYTYCFSLAKAEQSRNIEMDTSTAFWSVLLVPKYPIMSEVLAFIAEKGTYKATNKDLWSMMLEFCRTVDPSLKDYEADGAWPTLLDNFVAWKKSSLGTANGTGSA